MRFELSALQKAKMAMHTIQAILLFVTACIMIAMFSKDGKSDGRGKWFFTLIFLTIPALIYLVAVPMWSRAQKFAKVYAFVGLDVVYTILWLSAFASLIAWNRAGIVQGTTDKKIPLDEGNCSTFAYGSEAKCNLSHSAMLVGVFIFILFIFTSAISGVYVSKQRKEPMNDPWLSESKSYAPTPGGVEANKDPVWSADTQDIDNPGHRRSSSSGRATERGGDKEEDEYELLHGGTETDEGHHPGRPWADGGYSRPGQNVDTEYRGSHNYDAAGAANRQSYQAPSALSPDGYHSDHSPGFGRPSPAEFPEAPHGYGAHSSGEYR